MLSITCGRRIYVDIDNAGTLAYVLPHKGALYGVSASHVIGNYDTSVLDTQVSYIGPDETVLVGQISVYTSFRPGVPIYFDGALFKLFDGITDAAFFDGNTPMGYNVDVRDAQPVKMFGSTSGQRFGTIAKAKPGRMEMVTGRGTFLFADPILVRGFGGGLFSQGGDSGSMVLDQHNRIVGLVSGHIGTDTVVTRIQYLQRLLDIL